MAEQQVTSPGDSVSIYRAVWEAELELSKFPAYKGSSMENEANVLPELKAIKPTIELVEKIAASRVVSRLYSLSAVYTSS